MATSDPIAEIIGDYRGFAAMQRDRLLARGIDIAPYPLSHLAVRVADWDLYVHQRTLLEGHARANRENVWNGRPISLIVLAEPLDVLDGTPVSNIELIPPVHQRVYRMGLEHLGVVVGDEFDEFSRVHRAALTGRQFQSAAVDPVYVLFEDFTHVKLYRRSFFDVVEDAEGASRASTTPTTGCRSGWSPPPARTRSRADLRLLRGNETARWATSAPSQSQPRTRPCHASRDPRPARTPPGPP